MQIPNVPVSLQQIKTGRQRETLQGLWARYVEVLSQFRNFEKPAQKIAQEEAAGQDDRTDHLIMLGNDPVGFIAIGRYPNSFTKTDVFVQEFFVLPERQRQGIGTKAVKKFLEEQSLPEVSMFILRNNAPALNFWDNAMLTAGYFDRLRAGNINAITFDGKFYFRYYVKEEEEEQ